ncbi:prepilin peptidase CpaA [Gracilibacillus ureilyticus]|uniref:Prepilin peptidase CpaA n=2 Tax=Gracilibacillus ureilyticus TaxID=531814 RepID=A0A1H9V5P6_9BACI|nr:prepilin peptidase CpaA [Gracilibacillus ureilyticus]
MIDVFLLIILAICVITDLRSRKIYNKVVFPALLITFFYQFVTGGWESLSHSFIGFLIGFSLLLIPYFLGGIGAGDVKLLGLIGAMKGGMFVFQSFIYIALIGAVIALFVLFIRRDFWKSIYNYTVYKQRIKSGVLTGAYPYGIAIAGGVAVQIVMQGGTLL